jgi:hypothetical protein
MLKKLRLICFYILFNRYKNQKMPNPVGLNLNKHATTEAVIQWIIGAVARS